MNHWTHSGLAWGGSSQDVESTKRERLPTVSMQRFTSASGTIVMAGCNTTLQLGAPDALRGR